MSARRTWIVLAFLAVVLVLACRTADVLSTSRAGAVTPTETGVATRRTTRLPTFTPIVTQAAVAPTEIPPTDPPAPPPTQPPQAPIPTAIPLPTLRPRATEPPPPTGRPAPTETQGPQPTAGPTRCPQQYCAVVRACQPEEGNTVVEGIVYRDGAPENGVAVRVSEAPGAYPLVDDFISGTETVNRGKPDPNNPGRYILQVVPGAARKGTWYVFIVDVAGGTRQISEAVKIVTTDDPFAGGACQHAFVDFHR